MQGQMEQRRQVVTRVGIPAIDEFIAAGLKSRNMYKRVAATRLARHAQKLVKVIESNSPGYWKANLEKNIVVNIPRTGTKYMFAADAILNKLQDIADAYRIVGRVLRGDFETVRRIVRAELAVPRQVVINVMRPKTRGKYSISIHDMAGTRIESFTVDLAKLITNMEINGEITNPNEVARRIAYRVKYAAAMHGFYLLPGTASVNGSNRFAIYVDTPREETSIRARWDENALREVYGLGDVEQVGSVVTARFSKPKYVVAQLYRSLARRYGLSYPAVSNPAVLDADGLVYDFGEVKILRSGDAYKVPLTTYTSTGKVVGTALVSTKPVHALNHAAVAAALHPDSFTELVHAIDRTAKKTGASIDKRVKEISIAVSGMMRWMRKRNKHDRPEIRGVEEAPCSYCRFMVTYPVIIGFKDVASRLGVKLVEEAEIMSKHSVAAKGMMYIAPDEFMGAVKALRRYHIPVKVYRAVVNGKAVIAAVGRHTVVISDSVYGLMKKP